MGKNISNRLLEEEILTPWSNPKHPDIHFSSEGLEKLLTKLGWPLTIHWVEHWTKRGGVSLEATKWPLGTKSDWVWGIGFPLMSDLERFLETQNERVLFGLSGLPGCGKTSLGKWIEAAAQKLSLPINVISLDDFYFPYKELKKIMAGNPWGVPRALPGSHDIDLMWESISTWKETGKLLVPQFDKALQNGKGDRCGWRESNPKVLVIEGWFLGCQAKNSLEIKDAQADVISPCEKSYRVKILEELLKYQKIWEAFDRTWHLKATDFSSTNKWKREQERNMQRTRGSSLKGTELDAFLRMINTALPKAILENLNADVIAHISPERTINWVEVRGLE